MVQYYGNTREEVYRAAKHDGLQRNEVKVRGIAGDYTGFPQWNAYFRRKKDPRYITPSGSMPYAKGRCKNCGNSYTSRGGHAGNFVCKTCDKNRSGSLGFFKDL